MKNVFIRKQVEGFYYSNDGMRQLCNLLLFLQKLRIKTAFGTPNFKISAKLDGVKFCYDIHETVFHVAHPGVSGLVIAYKNEEKYKDKKDKRWVKVLFTVPVEFPSGKQQVWLCSEDLLCSTSEEAWKRHK